MPKFVPLAKFKNLKKMENTTTKNYDLPYAQYHYHGLFKMERAEELIKILDQYLESWSITKRKGDKGMMFHCRTNILALEDVKKLIEPAGFNTANMVQDF